MFLKNVYKNAFNSSDYRLLIRKPLSKAVIYTLMLILLSGTFSIFLGYFIQKDNILLFAQKTYDLIPEFTLSSEKFTIESEEPISFRFANRNFYIDDSRNLVDIVLNEKVSDDKEVLFIASDGYSVVKGDILKRFSYYNEVDYLDGINLSKDDFSIIYETLKMICFDIFILASIICAIFFAISVFVKAVVYSSLIKIIAKFKGENAKFKDLYKLSLYGQTLYILFYGIILLSATNLNFVFKMVFLEMMSLIYVVYIGLNYKKKRGVYNVNSKKRP